MMEITITKKDIIWSYAATFFNMAAGLITLPVVLKLLTPDEVGLNYILISINSIVSLFDMGFSSQFSRYLTYIFSGAQKIQKSGIADDYKDNVNEHLLACTIVTAKRMYMYVSFLAATCLLTFGSWYVYSVTDGFSLVNNIIPIWFVFCLSAFFNIYYLYLNSFLQGRGLIKETKQAQVYSRVCQIAISFTMLFIGCGLLSVVVANLIAPFVMRFFAYKKFFDENIIRILRENVVKKEEIKEVFIILFYNAKKLGVISILSSALGYASTLVIGSYLSLTDVASYGLMVQLTGIVMSVATIHFTSIVPKLSSLIVKKDYIGFRDHFGLSMFFFYLICLLGVGAMMFAVPIFKWCEFKTQLPAMSLILLYYFYKTNEQNQSLFSQLFLIENDFRFYRSAVWTGNISFGLLWLSLYLGYGLWGVVLSQVIPLFAYAAWKWPIAAVTNYEIELRKDIIVNPIIKLKNIYGRYF